MRKAYEKKEIVSIKTAKIAHNIFMRLDLPEVIAQALGRSIDANIAEVNSLLPKAYGCEYLIKRRRRKKDISSGQLIVANHPSTS